MPPRGLPSVQDGEESGPGNMATTDFKDFLKLGSLIIRLEKTEKGGSKLSGFFYSTHGSQGF